MFRAASLLLAAAILPAAVVGQIEGAFEADDLEHEFERLAYGSHVAHHHHGHRHLRHHHPHHRHHKRTSLFAESPASANAMPLPPPSEGFLPGRHPSVARKLEHMEEAMHDLARQKQTATTARSSLEDNVKKSIHHMNEAVTIKRELARTSSLLRAEEVKLKKLEDDRLRLDRTHGHLVSSLHHIMEPKIQFAETRLKQRQRMVHNLEAKAEEWKAKETRFHQASLANIERRTQTKRQLEAAAEAAEKARREQEAAKKLLEVVKHDVSFNVEGYRYAQTRAAAAESEEESGQKMEREAQHSLKRLSGILNMEQRRVDESMAHGKDRVQGKIHELQSIKERTHRKNMKLSEEYGAWQERQRDWARRVAATRQVSHVTSQDYSERQQAVLDAAQAKVAYDAESDSDWAWDEWPGAGKRDADEVNVSAD